MKSLSRIYSQTARAQLEAWNPSDLVIELAPLPESIQREEVLAILRKGKEDAAQAPGPRSPLLHRGVDLAVTAWQPGEMDWPTPFVNNSDDWDFPALPSPVTDEPKDVEEEIWKAKFEAEKEAAAILAQARAQAEEITLEARTAADKLVLETQDESDRAKQAGYEQGLAEARAEMAAGVKAAHATITELHEWQTALMAQAEQIMVQMVKEIAQTMFGEGIKLDPNALQINLNRVMENAQRLGDLNIFLNPRDAELLDSSWAEYQYLISGNKVRIIPSEKITSGGCIVKGNMGMVDAQVETQLAAVMNTFAEIGESNR